MSILHRRRRVADRKAPKTVTYTRDELEAMSAAQVQAIWESLGGEHQNKPSSIKAILASYE